MNVSVADGCCYVTWHAGVLRRAGIAGRPHALAFQAASARRVTREQQHSSTQTEPGACPHSRREGTEGVPLGDDAAHDVRAQLGRDRGGPHQHDARGDLQRQHVRLRLPRAARRGVAVDVQAQRGPAVLHRGGVGHHAPCTHPQTSRGCCSGVAEMAMESAAGGPASLDR